MRIGIDARMYGPKAATGIGNYIKFLLEELSKIDQVNDYYIFLNRDGYDEFYTGSKNFHKVLINCHWYNFKEQWYLPLILYRYRLDLVHFPHFNVPLFYLKKFIVTIHDVTPFFFPGPLVSKSKFRRLAYNLVIKQAITRANKIITISEHTKNNLVTLFKVKPEKIKRIYLGYRQNFSPIDAQDERLIKLRRDLHLDKPVIFYVGVWRDHKNLTGLVKAFDILKSSHNCQLVLGGQSNSRYREITDLINSSPYRQDIILPGFISDEDLPLYYSACDLFVLPSFCEGFGLVTLEAISCGKPVAASKTTSVPEILGDAGIYFDPHDPKNISEVMHRVLTDQSLYQKQQILGKNVLLKYNWQECARETLDVYLNR